MPYQVVTDQRSREAVEAERAQGEPARPAPIDRKPAAKPAPKSPKGK